VPSKKPRRAPDHTDSDSRNVHTASFKGGRRRKSSVLGTAIYVLAYDPDSGPIVRFQEDVLYVRCCKAGQRYVAYKWIANEVMQQHRIALASGSALATVGLDEHRCNPCEVWTPKMGCVKVKASC
jgi:hypothetical protein